MKNVHLRFLAVFRTYLSNKYLFSTFVTIVISEKIPTSLKILSSSLCESKTFFVFNCNIIYYCIDKHIFHCHLIICIDFNKKVYLIGVTVNGLSTKWLVSQGVICSCRYHYYHFFFNFIYKLFFIISNLSQFFFYVFIKMFSILSSTAYLGAAHFSFLNPRVLNPCKLSFSRLVIITV